MTEHNTSLDRESYRIKIFGIVQGVGFRPFVSRTAAEFHIIGDVCNKGSYVEIRARGAKEPLRRFLERIETSPPSRAVVLKILKAPLTDFPDADDFKIIESLAEDGSVFVSPDIAICPQCRAELFDKKNRRYLHPFINCTSCGPRLTILDSMPYDRERTSMGTFPMCPDCRYEYTHPETRRYDAQPVCCNACGPTVCIIDGEETGLAAIKRARRVLQAGGIVAVKGIGGFHLACDAQNEAAIKRLRERKHRPRKPFAIMMRDLATVRRECHLGKAQEKLLDNHQKPIVLLPKKRQGRIAPNAAPGMMSLGILLPYTPLHLLLFDLPDGLSFPDSLVMTSGNPSGAPICRTDEEAAKHLAPIADLILSHNREIRLQADDTVMDFYAGAPYVVRRSRGYAPLPLMLSANFQGSVLGIGGELKNTFCLAQNSLFYASPYLGDMGDLRTVHALRQSLARMKRLLGIRPEAVAADLHPHYETTRFAKTLGLPIFGVQHHYAHVLSAMAENNALTPVIGVSFDGTGYGTDGTIWGGEILFATTRGFERLGSLTPFLHPGGDIAAQEGWRIAVSLLYDSYGKETALSLAQELQLADEGSISAVLFLLEHGLNTIPSTSAGRLFDAVSALIGLCRISTYEGEAAMYLQFAAEKAEKAFPNICPEGPFSNPPAAWSEGGCLIECTDSPSSPAARFMLDTNGLFLHLLDLCRQGEAAERIALIFHQCLAAAIIKGCQRARDYTGCQTAALTGGVFQNTLLLRLTQQGLEKEGFRVLRHSLIPPNDGGISVGQALFAMQKIQAIKT